MALEEAASVGARPAAASPAPSLGVTTSMVEAQMASAGRALVLASKEASVPSPLPTRLSNAPTPPAAPSAETKVAEAEGRLEGKAVRLKVAAPGFRFHPTDEELVTYYLKRKFDNKPVSCNVIGEVDVYEYDPWELEEFSLLKTRDLEWYFFSPLDRMHMCGSRMNRFAKTGYWKATGKDRQVYHNSYLLGMKKTLVFHSGRTTRGVRTDWVMHEYRLSDDEADKYRLFKMYTLCKVFHKTKIGPPSNKRYAAFHEEDWEDDDVAGGILTPAEDARVDSAGDDDAGCSKEAEQQDAQIVTKELININELPTEAQLFNDHGRERQPANELELGLRLGGVHGSFTSEVCVTNWEAPLPMVMNKKRRHDDSGSSSNSSAIATRDHHSTPATASDSAKVDTPIPGSTTNIIKDLQNQIDQMSAEIKELRLGQIADESLITILQTRLDAACKDNEKLKQKIELKQKIKITESKE